MQEGARAPRAPLPQVVPLTVLIQAYTFKTVCLIIFKEPIFQKNGNNIDKKIDSSLLLFENSTNWFLDLELIKSMLNKNFYS